MESGESVDRIYRRVESVEFIEFDMLTSLYINILMQVKGWLNVGSHRSL